MRRRALRGTHLRFDNRLGHADARRIHRIRITACRNLEDDDRFPRTGEFPRADGVGTGRKMEGVAGPQNEDMSLKAAENNTVFGNLWNTVGTATSNFAKSLVDDVDDEWDRKVRGREQRETDDSQSTDYMGSKGAIGSRR